MNRYEFNYFTILLLCIIGVLLTLACERPLDKSSDAMPSLYSQPITVPINLDSGYDINPFTGDSIRPLINSLGDTIKSGVPIPAKGKLIHPDSVASPITSQAGMPEEVTAPTHIFHVPAVLNTVIVDESTLRKFSKATSPTPYVLMNSKKDTIPTGIPIPIKGKVIAYKHPKPIIAKFPTRKDIASHDFQFMDMDHGMNSSSINAILEDSKGNMWFGTEKGITRYDGTMFFHYTSKEGFPGTMVNAIIEDHNGYFWFACYGGGGVIRYDGNMFTQFSENEGLLQNTIWSIYEDKKGRIWIPTEKGVSCFESLNTTAEGVLTHYTINEGLSNNDITRIMEDQEGMLWFGTYGSGVCRYDGEFFTHFTEEDGLCFSIITSLLEDQHGNIWFGNNRNGVCRYEPQKHNHPGKFTHYSVNEGLPNPAVYSMLEDQKGNLWFGTLGGAARLGLIENDLDTGQTITTYTEKKGLTSFIIFSSFEDRSGNLWFGTNAGVNRFNPNSFTHVNVMEGMKGATGTEVYSIVKDHTGRVWFGGRNGMNSFEVLPDGSEEKYRHYGHQQLCSRTFPRSILFDSQNNLWFATQGDGVNRLELLENGYIGTCTNFSIAQGLSSNASNCIIEDKQGMLWFATDRGITSYDGKLFRQFSEKEGLPVDMTNCIYDDKKGRLWYGTEYGLTSYDGTFFTHYTEKEGLPGNIILSILEDKSGNLWFGTAGAGACRFTQTREGKDGTFTRYSEKEGLSDNTVRSLSEDVNGNIWVGTDNGLNKIIVDTNANHAGQIIPLGKQDGLKGTKFLENSIYVDHQNHIWYGCGRGVEVFDPDAFKVSSTVPQPHLRQLDINGSFLDYRNLTDSTGKGITFDSVIPFENYPYKPVLSYFNDHLTFHFSAIDWAAPHKILYSYRMDGLKDEWSAPLPQSNAEYRNLPSGNYTFLVRAIGESQQWSAPLTYAFKVHPPWWYSTLAYLLYFLICGAIVFRLYRFQLNRKLEIAEKKRLLQHDKLKNRLYANITHEFRTPLTLIHGPVSDALAADSVLDKNSLKNIHQQSTRLQQLITQMLDLQKAEAGKLKPVYVYGNIVSFVRYLFDAFESLANENGVTLVFSSTPEDILTDYDVEKLTQIISNLMSNAIKHTPRHGRISCLMNKLSSGNILSICIEDTGTGIPQEDLPFIFDHYYQSSRAAAGGTGIGLALTKNLVELLNGRITVNSTLEVGTTFEVILPITTTAIKETSDLNKPVEFEAKLYDDDTRFAPPDQVMSNRPIVLIVEDHPEVAQYVASCLTPDFITMISSDGNSGLKMAFEHIPDLIISDVMMPGKDGFELCSALKTDVRTSHIPVILLTGRGDQASLMEGLEHGADAYVVKPFHKQELLLRVRKLLELRVTLRQYYRQHTATETSRPIAQTSAKEHEFLLKIRSFIEEHINDHQLNMHLLSQYMTMSHPQLHRKITALTGESTGKFVRSVRLTRATELLRNSDLTISQIAYETGFNEPAYFTRVFSKEFNMSPSEFRANQGQG